MLILLALQTEDFSVHYDVITLVAFSCGIFSLFKFVLYEYMTMNTVL